MLTEIIDFLKENLTVSVIIISIILNVFYEVLKKLFFSAIRLSASKTNKWALRNTGFLLKHYEEERELLIKVNNRDGEELMKILKNTFTSIGIGLIITFLFFVLHRLDNLLLFYGMLGVFTSQLFLVVRNLYSNFRLIQKSKNLDLHLNRIDQRIIKI